MSDASGTARAYYRSLDEHDYDLLRGLLAPDVVHRRPDRTFEGRATLVSFMRDGRPNADTTHEIRAVYVEDGRPGAAENGADRGSVEETGSADETGDGGGVEVAVRGRLLRGDGDPLFAFVDVFDVAAGRIEAIETFTR